MENKDIFSVDETYEMENFSYSFESDDGNVEYAIIGKWKIDILKETDFKSFKCKTCKIQKKLFTKLF